ncbi:hypothetical protein SPRG_08764 [Saprolegnia parasitica CBS 223.65]|uniref:PHD-type domain-containing protein n=1 Tax=Saprolegnia parasitica (strain CBS 223.65) TaxID=695850 RepID=A0A067CH06_SAPPC|nr:hypothetical protein SPRG_08764 [Saprolegnia parasitica CBS 223.65]KDO25821.1 hypothetical protein SPRG_08764 [Saprolegnia parasitica CBS 223.65]|eukprot:XP_012203386.1 hypothetical protein SPRG_08764 [Saprolegnia parasitica CBS 223.65]
MTTVDVAMASIPLTEKATPVSHRSTTSDGSKSKAKDSLYKQDKTANAKKIVYPPRLLVDFKSLQMDALHKYVAFYQLPVREEYTKDDLASLVARHFDCSLEVEEDESILSFVTRVRNGEKASRTQRQATDKKVKAEAAAAKEAKKAAQQASKPATTSSNNKRPRPEETDPHDEPEKESKDDTAVQPAKLSKPKGGKSSKKEEDNELYCVCNLPSYGNMIACDGDKCPNPAQWYHLECVGISDGQQPDTWMCPECDPKAFAAVLKKKKKARKMQQQSGSSSSSSSSRR